MSLTDRSEAGEVGSTLQWLEWAGNTKSWVLVPALPHCVTLDKCLYVPDLWPFDLSDGGHSFLSCLLHRAMNQVQVR